jgi:hypothetical protein
MESIKFTEDELEKIKTIQKDYNSAGVALIQLKMLRRNLEEDLENLKIKEAEVDKQIFIISEEESQLSKSLTDKYGIGTLDLETGKFTAQK